MSLLTQLTHYADTRVTHRSAREGSVAGRIHGAHHGDLSSTIVFLYNRARRTITAPRLPIVAPDGTYIIHRVPPGRWMAFCQPAPATPLAAQTYKRKPGFTVHGTRIAVAAGETVRHVDFHLPEAGLLIVTVRDATGAPVPGATLLSLQLDAQSFTTGSRVPPTTDASGSANLANVPLQSKLAVVTPNGNVKWWDRAPSKHRSKALVISAQGHVLPVEVTLPPGA
jgi:hypothetical protein